MVRAGRPATSKPRKGNTPATAPPGGLSPLELYALVVLSRDAAKWRDALPEETTRKVDFLLWIEGEVAVGANDPHHIAKSTPKLVDVLEYLFGRLDAEARKRMRAGLVRAFKDGKRPKEAAPEIKRAARGTLELITEREPKPKRGDVTGRLVVTRMPRDSMAGG